MCTHPRQKERRRGRVKSGDRVQEPLSLVVSKVRTATIIQHNYACVATLLLWCSKLHSLTLAVLLLPPILITVVLVPPIADLLLSSLLTAMLPS